MSTMTTMPASSRAARRRVTSRVTLARVLHSEWIKFWSLRSTLWTLTATVVVMATVSYLAVFFTAREAFDSAAKPKDAAPLVATPHDPSLVLTGVDLTKLIIAVLGVLIVTGEYSTGMIRSTLTAVPKRLPAFWAKALVLIAVTAGTAVVAVLLSWMVALPTLHAHHAALDLGDLQTRRILLGGVLYLVAISLLAFAVGAIVRHSAGALATVLGPSQIPSSRRRHDSQCEESSPWRAGSGSTGGRSGATRKPAGSNGLISQPVMRDRGSRLSTSAAAIAWS